MAATLTTRVAELESRLASTVADNAALRDRVKALEEAQSIIHLERAVSEVGRQVSQLNDKIVAGVPADILKDLKSQIDRIASRPAR